MAKTIRGPFGAEKGITTNNIGTVASGSSVVEYGDGIFHQTAITVNTTLAEIASGNHSYGKLIYTFPAGALDVKATYISMALTQSDGNITADTPDIGVGTTTATGGTSATLNGGTMENIMPGQTVADGWAGTDAACAIAGTIIIEWTFVV